MNVKEARTLAKQNAYLEALVRLKISQRACKEVGIHWTLPRSWRRRFPAFAAREQKAHELIANGINRWEDSDGRMDV